MIEPNDESLLHRIEIGDFVEGSPLAALRALSVAGVNKRKLVRLARNRSRDAGIHPAAQQDDRLGLPAHEIVDILFGWLKAEPVPVSFRWNPRLA
jgi:hypothetical protein